MESQPIAFEKRRTSSIPHYGYVAFSMAVGPTSAFLMFVSVDTGYGSLDIRESQFGNSLFTDGTRARLFGLVGSDQPCAAAVSVRILELD